MIGPAHPSRCSWPHSISLIVEGEGVVNIDECNVGWAPEGVVLLDDQAQDEQVVICSESLPKAILRLPLLSAHAYSLR